MRTEGSGRLPRALLGDPEARRALTEPADRTSSPEGAELVRFDRAWAELELPPPAPVPPGFATRVAAAARSERNPLPGFSLSPGWAGVAVAVLVALGVASGAGFSYYALPGDDDEVVVAGSEDPDDPTFWADDGLLDQELLDPTTDATDGTDAAVSAGVAR